MARTLEKAASNEVRKSERQVIWNADLVDLKSKVIKVKTTRLQSYILISRANHRKQSVWVENSRKEAVELECDAIVWLPF